MTLESNYPIIAGKHGGKRIRCTPALEPVYKKLESAAASGNHWANIAIKELSAFSSGPLGKSNVYVKPSDQCRYDGSYTVFLPGLKATIENRDGVNYLLVHLVVDANYYLAVSGAGEEQTRMGLYRVTQRGQGSWETDYVDNGQVLPKDGRLVAITDTINERASDAALDLLPRAKNFPNVSGHMIKQQGCDLHFTPGTKRLGGMVRYNALAIDDCRGSAVQLAETMTQAKGQPGVYWVTDHAGAAVLTQAMQILVDRGITLKGHSAYLHRPRTSPAKALRLAHQLKLDLNESFAGTGLLDIQGAVSQLSVAGQRLSNKTDDYNKGYHWRSWGSAALKAGGTLGLVSLGAATMGASIPMLGAIATVIGTSGAACAVGQSLNESHGHKLKR